MNVQFVIVGAPAYRSPMSLPEDMEGTSVYVLEVNPRASRTVPFISKVTGVPVVSLATRVMLGKKLKDMGYEGGLWKKQDVVGIKAPVFSMSKLTGVDWHLGPEMKSTGEVMGIDHEFRPALAKALAASDLTLKQSGAVLLSIADKDKAESAVLVEELQRAGFTLYATEGTAAMVKNMGTPVTMITKKLSEGRPNVVDVINQGLVDGVINTVSETASAIRDGFYIRRAAVEKRIPCYTSLDTARAAVESLLMGSGSYRVKTTAEYLAGS